MRRLSAYCPLQLARRTTFNFLENRVEGSLDGRPSLVVVLYEIGAESLRLNA